jgi:hypothetical protein
MVTQHGYSHGGTSLSLGIIHGVKQNRQPNTLYMLLFINQQPEPILTGRWQPPGVSVQSVAVDYRIEEEDAFQADFDALTAYLLRQEGG